MGVITFRNDPNGITGTEKVIWNKSVTDYLISINADPDYISIIMNGKVITNDGSDNDVYRPLCMADEVIVIQFQKALSAVQMLLVAVAASVAVYSSSSAIHQPQQLWNNARLSKQHVDSTDQPSAHLSGDS